MNQIDEPVQLVQLQDACGEVGKPQRISKRENVEIKRLDLPAGKEIPAHSNPGQVIVQCIAGKVLFSVEDQEMVMTAGTLLHLAPGAPHALKAAEDSAMLITLVR